MDQKIKKSCHNSCNCLRKEQMNMPQQDVSHQDGLSSVSRLSLARLAAVDCLYADLMRSFSALEREFRQRMDEHFDKTCEVRKFREGPCTYARSHELLSSFCNCGLKKRSNTLHLNKTNPSSQSICKCCQYTMGSLRCSDFMRSCRCSECSVNSNRQVSKSKMNFPKGEQCSDCESKDETSLPNNQDENVKDSLTFSSAQGKRREEENGSQIKKRSKRPKRTRHRENVIDESSESEDSLGEEVSDTRDLVKQSDKNIQTDNTSSVGDSKENAEEDVTPGISWEGGTGDVKHQSSRNTTFYFLPM